MPVTFIFTLSLRRMAATSVDFKQHPAETYVIW